MKNLFIFCVINFQLATFVYSQEPGDWMWLHPKPQGMTLYGVQRINSTTWYFAGVNGVFMKTTDNGVSWSYKYNAGKPAQGTGVGSAVWGIYFIDENTGFTVGGLSSIMKTTDAGNTWNPVQGNPLSDSRNLFSVSFVDSQTGFITGASGTFLKTTDGGNNWSLISLGTTAACYSSWSSDGNLILVATNNGQLKRSTNGGAAWTTINTSPTFNITKIAGTANNLYIAGAAGNVQRSTNSGASWASVNSGIPATAGFNDMDVVNGKIYLTGQADVIYYSTNSGSSWSTISLTTPETSILTSRMATDTSPDGDTLFVASGFGIILSKQGASASMKSHTNSMTITNGNAIWASQNGKYIYSANNNNNGHFLRSTDFGATWTFSLVKPGSPHFMTAIQMFDSLNGFIGGNNCALFKTTDGGMSWDSMNTSNTNPTAQITKIAFVSPVTGWIFLAGVSTTAGTIFKTTNGGVSWFRQPLGIADPEPNVGKAAIVDSLHGWLIGTLGVYKTMDGGNTWSKDSLEGGLVGQLNDIQMVDASNGYIVANGGRVYKTTNGGGLWQLLTVPLGLNLSSIQLSGVNNVFVFGVSGIFLTSTDGGVTWLIKNLNSAAAAYGSYKTWDPDANTLSLYATCQFGFILKSVTSVVPIELTGFSAATSGRNVMLNWTTATELNNRGFEIQRKRDGNDWETLSFVNGKGTSTKISEYRYVDENLVEGTYSYRIKQMDFDGSLWYSYSVEVEIGTPMSFNLSQNFPNPFNPTTVIRYELPVSGHVTLSVYNSLGEEVATLVNSIKEAGSHSITFDASKFASGIYIYKLKSGDFSTIKKMSLIK